MSEGAARKEEEEDEEEEEEEEAISGISEAERRTFIDDGET